MEFLGSAPATMIFLIATVLISLAAFANQAIIGFGLLHSGAILKGGDWYRIFTSGFLHADAFHLLANMITLFFFGPALERQIGSQNFMLVYVGALLAGSLFALFRHSEEDDYRALGASGAVSGVLLAFCLFAPFQMIYFFGIVPVPAILFAVLFIAYSIFGMKAQMDNIGHDAHLGGAVAGVALTIILFPSSLSTFMQQISSFLS